jgi:multiple antibiotic resistance protein
LVWMGLSMLGVRFAWAGGEVETAEASILTALILFAASRGTIAGVITLSATHSPNELPVTSLVPVGVATSVSLLVLLLSIRVAGKGGQSGLLHDVVTRFMGWVVLAMGIPFGLTGARAFMTAG